MLSVNLTVALVVGCCCWSLESSADSCAPTFRLLLVDLLLLAAAAVAFFDGLMLLFVVTMDDAEEGVAGVVVDMADKRSDFRLVTPPFSDSSFDVVVSLEVVAAAAARRFRLGPESPLAFDLSTAVSAGVLALVVVVVVVAEALVGFMLDE
jgi:hypothetical protein